MEAAQTWVASIIWYMLLLLEIICAYCIFYLSILCLINVLVTIINRMFACYRSFLGDQQWRFCHLLLCHSLVQFYFQSAWQRAGYHFHPLLVNIPPAIVKQES